MDEAPTTSKIEVMAVGSEKGVQPPCPGWVEAAKASQKYTCASGLSICTQPAGYWTDYLVAGASLGFGLTLVCLKREDVWVVGFLLSSALSAFAGGVTHQYCRKLIDSGDGTRDGLVSVLWSSVLFLGSFPNFFMAAGAAWLVFSSDSDAWVASFVCIGVYLTAALVVAFTRRILVHIIVSLPTLLFLATGCIVRFSRLSSKWFLAGTLLLVVCGGVIALKLTPSKQHFNHNAVMHCILLLACSCMFFGALL